MKSVMRTGMTPGITRRELGWDCWPGSAPPRARRWAMRPPRPNRVTMLRAGAPTSRHSIKSRTAGGPAAEICARARSAGARVLIDAAQSAPHVGLDVQSLGCDFLVFSAHKMLGPMGTGVVWARRELLEQMQPYQVGSNMAHRIDLTSQHFERAARKFGAGTPNVSGAVGLAAAVRYLGSQDRHAIERHEARLTRHALAQLTAIPGLRLLGPSVPAERVPLFSFVLGRHSPQEVLRHLDSRGIAVRAGDLAALPLLKRFGVSAAARASCYLYTQIEEIDRLVAALRELVSDN